MLGARRDRCSVLAVPLVIGARCGVACRVADFDGCFAVTCDQCLCSFCAWCLKDCGANAHPHVLVCPRNLQGGGYYGTQEEFEASNNTRREQVIDRWLRIGDCMFLLRRAECQGISGDQACGISATVSAIDTTIAPDPRPAAHIALIRSVM